MINLQYIENNLLYVVRMLQAARALMPHDEESEIDRLEELKRKARENTIS